MVLTSCSYIPLEIPLALGIPAGRAFFEKPSSSCEAYLPRDFCPYAKAFIRQYSREDVVVMAGSCDAMRRVYDVLQHFGLAREVYFVDVPRSSSSTAVAFYADVLKDFARYLARLRREVHGRDSGSVADVEDPLFQTRLLATTRCLNELRTALGRIFELQAGGPGQQVRVGVSGTCLLDALLLESLEEAGLSVAFIDSCLAPSSVNLGVPREGAGGAVASGSCAGADPFQVLALGYLRKPPCPRMFVGRARSEYLRRLVASSDAQGLVYFAPKFCDLAYYDFSGLKRDLGEAGRLPMLLLEGEYGSGKSGQTLTRVVAFREMLEGRSFSR